MNNKGRIEFLIASISGTRGEILNKKGRIEFSITLISGTGGEIMNKKGRILKPGENSEQNGNVQIFTSTNISST